MYDLFIYGFCAKNSTWYQEFEKNISEDIKIYNSFLQEATKVNQVAKKLYILEECTVAAFYFEGGKIGAKSRTLLGHSIGKGRNVIVCIVGDIKDEGYLRHYLERNGAIIVDNLNSFIAGCEELVAQVDCCII